VPDLACDTSDDCPIICSSATRCSIGRTRATRSAPWRSARSSTRTVRAPTRWTPGRFPRTAACR